MASLPSFDHSSAHPRQSNAARAAQTAARRLYPSATFPAGQSFQLAQLLSSRLCHDLIGPIGIAAASDDLRNADDHLDEEALALVTEGARSAASRLALFRYAFGFGQHGSGAASVSMLLDLAERALATNRLRIDRNRCSAHGGSQDESLSIAEARLLLCLLLIATEALPRGGSVAVTVADGAAGRKLGLRASGTGARIPSALEAFAADSCADLTPRTVVGFYAGQLAAQLGACVEVTDTAGDGIELTVSIPVQRTAGDAAGGWCHKTLAFAKS